MKVQQQQRQEQESARAEAEASVIDGGRSYMPAAAPSPGAVPFAASVACVRHLTRGDAAPQMKRRIAPPRIAALEIQLHGVRLLD